MASDDEVIFSDNEVIFTEPTSSSNLGFHTICYEDPAAASYSGPALSTTPMALAVEPILETPRSKKRKEVHVC